MCPDLLLSGWAGRMAFRWCRENSSEGILKSILFRGSFKLNTTEHLRPPGREAGK